jgi:hypothetical protein
VQNLITLDPFGPTAEAAVVFRDNELDRVPDFPETKNSLGDCMWLAKDRTRIFQPEPLHLLKARKAGSRVLTSFSRPRMDFTLIGISIKIRG